MITRSQAAERGQYHLSLAKGIFVISGWRATSLIPSAEPDGTNELLRRRLTKVVAQQHAHRNGFFVLHRGKEVHLLHGIDHGLVQTVTGPAGNLNTADFTARIHINQDIDYC